MRKMLFLMIALFISGCGKGEDLGKLDKARDSFLESLVACGRTMDEQIADLAKKSETLSANEKNEVLAKLATDRMICDSIAREKFGAVLEVLK